MKRPQTSNISNEWLKYVEYLEGRGIQQLQLTLANVCNILAQEINLAVEGKNESLKILVSDDKIFEKILAIVKAKKDFDALTLITTSEETTVKKVKKNIQDFVVKS